MLDTMTLTKVVGSLCGALLVFLLGNWVAEEVYHMGGIRAKKSRNHTELFFKNLKVPISIKNNKNFEIKIRTLAKQKWGVESEEFGEHAKQGFYTEQVGEYLSMLSDIVYKIDNEIEYDLNKIDRNEIPKLRRDLGIVFQDFQLLSDRTVNENLKFVLKATGWTKKEEISKRINDVLASVHLENYNNKMPHELSGGEKQRAAIARSLLNNPKVILADEPTGSLDPKKSEKIIELLKEINEKGTTVVIATHDYEIIKKFNARIIKCSEKKLQEIGYHIKTSILDTNKITNIPQHRERIYIVGFRDKEKYDKFNFDFVEQEPGKICDMLEENVNDKYYYTNRFKVFKEIEKGITKNISENVLYQYTCLIK